jgi:hypothetical protein
MHRAVTYWITVLDHLGLDELRPGSGCVHLHCFDGSRTIYATNGAPNQLAVHGADSKLTH